ncbi:amidophosphoribosyltransferase [Clostridium botulinum]|nr:amidophosphoribosyltransferase [Clostridium botulinum]ACO86739.1 amidophosphoribosyltransferase [Clostridium botulinum A2 str. Kyoto]APH23894.1 amidophosphoribosyltransferase [Clostridium botulinum]APQ69613.1 amidophosphoribosyltransferase [Clostridium botulinum]EPS55333.1 amidophosphoribosyltransferase [Clostridium botulinum Af84]OPD21603.1 amidophosphoribosyltransferase [Clostridium botulinum]
MLFDRKQDKFREECGVFGVFKDYTSELGEIFYPGLVSLQHRGEESSGISYTTSKGMITKKALGMVSNLFSKEDFYKMKYFSTIGHVRYSTSGNASIENAQPFQEETIDGSISLAHNGNLLNYLNIKYELDKKGIIFKSNSDSEIILKFILEKIQEVREIEKAIAYAINTLKGAFSVLILTEDKLIGFRDKNGIRPLCLGKIEGNYVLSSESASIDVVGGEYIRDVDPGEIVVINKKGIKFIKNKEVYCSSLCALEYIYFSRPDSIIDGINLSQFRIKCGEKLYEKYKLNSDIVMGVPESGNFAALGYSKESNIPYSIGLIKNSYVGRNFIKATEKERKRDINIKINAIKSIVQDKSVIVIDDSIVRGTSSKKVVSALKKAGAREVHFMVASPKINYYCNLGIDIKSKKELLSFQKTKEEMRKFIGADSLEFLSLIDMEQCLNKSNICTGCFDGSYANY